MSGGPVLVTGAGGFIGRALSQRFRELGVEVLGVDRQATGDGIFAGDTGEPEAWGHLLERARVVVHTAALVTNAMPDEEMWRVNVRATRNLLAAARRRGVRRFVHVSSIVVYGNAAVGELDEEHPVHAHGGSYVTTKLASEHVVLAERAQHGLDVVIVRPGDVYGPGSRPWVVVPLDLIRKRQFLLPARGQGFFRPVYIDDLTRGIAAASLSERASGQILNLSSRGYVTTKEFFTHHHRWMGRSGPLCVPTWAAVVLAAGSSRGMALFGLATEGSVASIRQLATRSWYSIDKAQSLLGWAPEVSLEEGLRRSREWAQAQGLLDAVSRP